MLWLIDIWVFPFLAFIKNTTVNILAQVSRCTQPRVSLERISRSGMVGYASCQCHSVMLNHFPNSWANVWLHNSKWMNLFCFRISPTSGTVGLFNVCQSYGYGMVLVYLSFYHVPCFFFFKFNLNLFIYLFLAVLGLCFFARAFSSCGKQGPLFITVRGPLTIVASLVTEHRLQTRRLSSCGSRA